MQEWIQNWKFWTHFYGFIRHKLYPMTGDAHAVVKEKEKDFQTLWNVRNAQSSYIKAIPFNPHRFFSQHQNENNFLLKIENTIFPTITTTTHLSCLSESSSALVLRGIIILQILCHADEIQPESKPFHRGFLSIYSAKFFLLRRTRFLLFFLSYHGRYLCNCSHDMQYGRPNILHCRYEVVPFAVFHSH